MVAPGATQHRGGEAVFNRQHGPGVREPDLARSTGGRPGARRVPSSQWHDMLTRGYPCTQDYDELIGPDGNPRAAAVGVTDFIESLGHEHLRSRQLAAEADIRALGITFTVYDNRANIDRQWPFDIIPRIVHGREWARIERGLSQRLFELNLFIDDLYNDQKVVRD